MSSLTNEGGFAVEAGAPATPVAASALPRLVAIADRLLYVAFLLAVFFSPFEAGYPPLTRFFNSTFTNLEVVLLALAATLAIKLIVDPTARTRLVRIPLLAPIAALLISCVLSYVFAEWKGEGINFTYRIAMGVMVFVAAREAISSTRRLLWTLGVLILASSISVVAGLLEYSPLINIEPLLAAFKPMPTTVGGTVRLSGTFEYANGAAFYFEMVLPVVVGLAILFSARDLISGPNGLGISERLRRVAQIVLFALSGIFTLALLLTFSRAALGGFLVALVVFGLVALLKRKSDPQVVVIMLRGLAAAAVVIGVGVFYIFLTQPIFRLRLTTENDRNWYTATYSAAPLPALSAGEQVTVPVTLRNTGPMIWRADGALVVHLGYHWRSADKQDYVIFEGERTGLPHDIGPGESVTVDALLLAPPKPGTYYLEWDLAQEHYTWFSAKAGAISALTRADVAEPTAAQLKQNKPAALPPPMHVDQLLFSDKATLSRMDLWKVAFRMFRAHPLTGVGPDGFRNVYGLYAGVSDWNRSIYSNNTYVEMFADLGLLGGLSFVWLAVLALYRAGRNVLREKPGVAWFMGLGATASMAAFFFHGFLDYFLFSTPLYMIFWLLLSIAVLWPLMVGREPIRVQSDE